MHNKNDYCRRAGLGVFLPGLAVVCQPLMAAEDDRLFAGELSLNASHLVEARSDYHRHWATLARAVSSPIPSHGVNSRENR